MSTSWRVRLSLASMRSTITCLQGKPYCSQIEHTPSQRPRSLIAAVGRDEDGSRFHQALECHLPGRWESLWRFLRDRELRLELLGGLKRGRHPKIHRNRHHIDHHRVERACASSAVRSMCGMRSSISGNSSLSDEIFRISGRRRSGAKGGILWAQWVVWKLVDLRRLFYNGGILLKNSLTLGLLPIWVLRLANT